MVPAASNELNIDQTGLNIVFHIRGGHLGPFCPNENVPGGPQKWPILAQNCHIGHKWLKPPQMGSTLVKLGWTLYFMFGPVIHEGFSGGKYKWASRTSHGQISTSMAFWTPLVAISGRKKIPSPSAHMSPHLFHPCSTFFHPLGASRTDYGQKISTFMATNCVQ